MLEKANPPWGKREKGESQLWQRQEFKRRTWTIRMRPETSHRARCKSPLSATSKSLDSSCNQDGSGPSTSSPSRRPIAAKLRHTGYVVSGRMKVVMEDRSEADLGPGDAYVIEPGHDAWIVGDEPFVGVDVSVETVEAFAKEEGAQEEEDKGLIDRAKDRLSGQ